jgi:hypothetical protein
MILVTYCDSEVKLLPKRRELFATLCREGKTINLDGLDEGEVSELVKITVGHPPAKRLVTNLFDVTEGNPFFVSEIVRLIASERRVDHSALQEVRDFDVPEGVKVVVSTEGIGPRPGTRHGRVPGILTKFRYLPDTDAAKLHVANGSAWNGRRHRTNFSAQYFRRTRARACRTRSSLRGQRR